jgi:hypothetical protein
MHVKRERVRVEGSIYKNREERGCDLQSDRDNDAGRSLGGGLLMIELLANRVEGEGRTRHFIFSRRATGKSSTAKSSTQHPSWMLAKGQSDPVRRKRSEACPHTSFFLTGRVGAAALSSKKQLDRASGPELPGMISVRP